MGSFGDLLYDLASAAGHGLEKGMAAKRKEEEEASAFKRMTPLALERQRGVKGLEEEYTIAGEGRKAAAEMTERGRIHGLLAPLLEGIMPPVTSEVAPTPTSEYGPRAPVKETRPFKVSPETSLPAYKEVFDLLGKQAQPPRAPTQVEMQVALTNPSHPLHAQAKRYFYGETGTAEAPGAGGFIDIQGRVAGTKLAGTEGFGPTRQQKMGFMGQYESAKPTRDFITARDAYARVESVGGQDTPAGDVALIFGLMKMLDPISVVREGEFETARKTAAIDDRLWNAFNLLRTGQRLTPNQRQDFLETAKRTFGGHVTSQEEFEKTHRGLAGALGMSESDVPDVLGRYRPKPGGAGQPGQGKIIKDYGGGYILRSR